MSELLSRVDPLIASMIRKIPAPNSEWPSVERLRWFRAMASILELVYDDEENRTADSPLIQVALQARGSAVPSAPPEPEPSWLDCAYVVPGANFLYIFPDPPPGEKE